MSGQLEGTLLVIRDHRWFWSWDELGDSREKSLLGTLLNQNPALQPGICVFYDCRHDCRQESIVQVDVVET